MTEQPDEPIRILGELGEDPAPDFIERFRATIHRREMAAQFVDLSWSGVAVVLVEIIRMVAGLFSTGDRTNGRPIR